MNINTYDMRNRLLKTKKYTSSEFFVVQFKMKNESLNTNVKLNIFKRKRAALIFDVATIIFC